MKSREILVKQCFSKAHLKTVRRVVKADPRILLEEDLRFQTGAAAAPGSSLFVAANIFRGMRNPGIGFARIEDGSMVKTNREEKSCGTGWREGGQRGDAGGNLPLRQHCESTHLAESGSCGYRPSDADRG